MTDSRFVLMMLFGMLAATYIPRALPVLFVGRIKLGRRLEKFLKLIPYTAMTALIFPGIFTVDASHPIVGIVGALVAAVLAWRKCPLILCVLGAIGADFLLYLVL